MIPTTGRSVDDAAATLARVLSTGGARAAGRWLVEQHAEDVYGLCRAIVRDRHVAEDLAHDAFARALSALPDYRGEASPRTWLLTIARHRCFDHLRARKRERGLLFEAPQAEESAPSETPLPIDELTSAESLRNALDALDEGDRALVVLRHAHGMDFAALADVFGVREGAVRMRLSRATARMREALEEPSETTVHALAMEALPAACFASSFIASDLAPILLDSDPHETEPTPASATAREFALPEEAMPTTAIPRERPDESLFARLDALLASL